MESRFSLFIPTKNRHALLTRSLNYLKKLHFKYPIFIADSSIEPYTDCDNYKELNINYFFTELDGWDKLNYFAIKTKSEFLLMLGDDDFLITENLEKILDFLLINPGYGCASGIEIKFIKKGNNLDFFVFKQPSLSSSSYLKRIKAHCKLYFPTFYFIHRREVLLNSLSTIRKPNISLDSVPLEILTSIATVSQGKVKVFHEEPFIFRQIYHERSTIVTQWSDILKQNIFLKIKENMLENLYTLLHPEDTEIKNIEKSLDIYFKMYTPSKIKSFIREYINAYCKGKILKKIKKNNNFRFIVDYIKKC
ncbi:MAG: TIGR00180 family glycosyltransferase [Rickettsia endosymbiont of Ixodes persulcatus]|nr:TIGR00180 family glycosyltransferase [Rickettsia endosymbiont of Ixodes persulcatus]MCZ6910224.1 TIGR00180 family glycosyltransferase [Rickettsia endosymbiont of Ixodes persulcatus]